MGIICPPSVGIGLTDLPNIGREGSGPPAPPVPASLRVTAFIYKSNIICNCLLVASILFHIYHEIVFHSFVNQLSSYSIIFIILLQEWILWLGFCHLFVGFCASFKFQGHSNSYAQHSKRYVSIWCLKKLFSWNNWEWTVFDNPFIILQMM